MRKPVKTILLFMMSFSTVLVGQNKNLKKEDTEQSLNARPDTVTKIQIIADPNLHPNVRRAIKSADSLLRLKAFYKEIAKRTDFTFTIETPGEIADYLKRSELKLRVKGYKGGEGKTLAYVTPEHKNVIFINIDKVERRSKASITSTIIHEIVHSVDRTIEDSKFGHGGNSAAGKESSAPYAIGSIAEKLVDKSIDIDKKEYIPEYVEESEDIDELKVVN